MYFCTNCFYMGNDNCIGTFMHCGCPLRYKMFINSEEFLDFFKHNKDILPSNIVKQVIEYVNSIPQDELEKITEISLDDIELNENFEEDFYGNENDI